MIRKIVLQILFLTCLLFTVCSQQIKGNTAFKKGEVMTFDAYYNLGMLWVKVGYASFAVEDEAGNYKFTIKADNLPKWNWLYEVHTVHTASMNTQMSPLYMKAVTLENGLSSNVHYGYKNNKIYKWEKSDIFPKGRDTTFHHVPYSYDIINSVYIARNVDLTQNNGKDIPFYVMFNDKVNVIYGSVVGKEKITTRNNETYNCIKCTAKVTSGTIFDENAPVNIWVTDDNRKIPVLVEAKISVGYVKVYLSGYKESY